MKKESNLILAIDNLIEFTEILKKFTSDDFIVTHNCNWPDPKPLRISKNALKFIQVNNDYIDFYVDMVLIVRISKNDCYYIDGNNGLFVTVFNPSAFHAIEYNFNLVHESIQDKLLTNYACHQIGINDFNDLPYCLTAVDNRDRIKLTTYQYCLNNGNIYYCLKTKGHKTEIWVSEPKTRFIQY
jgi:hypothetical protein